MCLQAYLGRFVCLNLKLTLHTCLTRSAYSASLTSSVLDYKYTHGRRYHAYHAGSYQFPNDEQEQERLDLLHHVYVHLACEGKLHFPPFKPDGARILDMGTGTGMWAIEM